jgi:hypothetical protein
VDKGLDSELKDMPRYALYSFRLLRVTAPFAHGKEAAWRHMTTTTLCAALCAAFLCQMLSQCPGGLPMCTVAAWRWEDCEA